MEPTVQALQDSISKGNYKKALFFCSKKLETDPDDVAVKHTKCLCYIQLGMYEEADSYIQTLESDLKDKLTTETAYTLYKLRKHKEALEIINTIKDPSVAILHLKGQTYYRLGDHKRCKEIFQEIREKEDSTEILVNIAAVNVLANQFDTEMKEKAKSNQESFELAFNISCLLVQNNQLAEAEQQLILAESLSFFFVCLMNCKR